MKNEFKTLIEKSNKIYIASHINPDGDNIGSILGLYRYLKNLNKDVYVIEDDIMPDYLQFLPNSKNTVKSKDLSEDSDLFISLDCADLDRLGECSNRLKKSKKSVNIDHHLTNTNFADLNIVDAQSPATGEILYNLLKYIDENKIDKEVATCLYTAISSDTGSFKYDSVRPETFIIASELMKKGIDINKIGVNLYQKKSFEKTKLLMSAFQTLELYENKRIGIVYINDDMINKCNAKKEDSEGIVEFIRDISGIEVAVFMKIKKDSIKLSIRTKEEVDATSIVSHFNGGGHKRAAGATLELPFKERKDELINIISKELNR